MIKLNEVVYDVKARDGTWCRLPYSGHPKGCPNFPECPDARPDFLYASEVWTHWYALVEEFDLSAHALRMRRIHPTWTERQCRNLLYWQGRVRKTLFQKAWGAFRDGDIILDIPEACGVNVFETMAKAGINIEKHPDIVRKVMLIGKG